MRNTLCGIALAFSFSLPAQAIVGGRPTEPAEFPAVAYFGYCSGVLVAPDVVLTAAHCRHEERQPQKVAFGDGSRHNVSFCTSYEDYTGFGRGNDWAVCVLDQPVADIAPVAIASGCELDTIYARTVSLVGFGRDDNKKKGVKRVVDVQVNSVQNGEISVGGNGKAACHADSGGPAFIRLTTGELRVLGVISYTEGACGQPENIALTHRAAPWIEEVTGEDPAPCFSSDGSWDPTSTCGHRSKKTGIFSSRGETEATWKFESTCGPAYPEFNGKAIPMDIDPDMEPASSESGCSVTQNNSPILGLVIGFLLLAFRRAGAPGTSRSRNLGCASSPR